MPCTQLGQEIFPTSSNTYKWPAVTKNELRPDDFLSALFVVLTAGASPARRVAMVLAVGRCHSGTGLPWISRTGLRGGRPPHQTRSGDWAIVVGQSPWDEVQILAPGTIGYLSVSTQQGSGGSGSEVSSTAR